MQQCSQLSGQSEYGFACKRVLDIVSREPCRSVRNECAADAGSVPIRILERALV